MRGFGADVRQGYAQQLGWPGAVGAGLIVMVCGLYFSALRPEQMHLEELQQERSRQREVKARPADAGPASVVEKLSAFYESFPPSERLPDLLGQVYAAAEKQTLKLERGEYRVIKDNVGRLLRYQIVFPVKGSYPQIRKFVSGALAAVPSLTLDSIELERQKAADTVVEAKVKLIVYLGQRP